MSAAGIRGAPVEHVLAIHDAARIVKADGKPVQRAIASVMRGFTLDGRGGGSGGGELRRLARMAEQAQHPPAARRAKGVAKPVGDISAAVVTE